MCIGLPFRSPRRGLPQGVWSPVAEYIAHCRATAPSGPPTAEDLVHIRISGPHPDSRRATANS
ncbi:hypothetical protein K523DRAFT_322263 [Schizophyllum commune Tattone D]|nr:hypothetical protein K523DRAFT_322263 [Schizophyllum commune Tattone D]